MEKVKSQIWYQNIINSLLLNASFIDNIGLMHGKMGISICFYHLARQTKNKIYEDYAGELIDEIYEEITANTSVDFENGLAGIGWGIEYLVQNGFIDADTDEVLEEFDNWIFKELIYNTPNDINLLNGIIGLGVYFLKRIQNPASNNEKIPTLTNKQTLIHLIDELDRKIQNIIDIIPELIKFSNNRQTFEPPNNSQTMEPSNKIFDLTWNYPTLLWFLAELYEQSIFNFKVEKMIQRLIEPLIDNTNLPKLHSNRLLLALALTKLQQTRNDAQQTKVKPPSNPQKIIEPSNLETIIDDLLAGMNRNTIKSELSPNAATIRYGMPGITWIYEWLYELTREIKFRDEFNYWKNQNPLNEIEGNKSDKEIRDVDNWGLLVGFSGNILVNLIEF